MKLSKTKLAALGLAALFSFGSANLRAEGEEVNADQKVRMEALDEAVEGLNKRIEELEMVRVEGFTDLRYDDVQTTDPATRNIRRSSGVYARRAEFKFHGKIPNMPSVKYALGFDFTELKHKDLGIEISDISMIPLVDMMPEYTWALKVGQFRQPFGIVPQTSSSSINFAERPMIFGGANAVGGSRLVGERVMGAQVRQKKAFVGVFSYDFQAGGFNNATEDQASGKNKLSDAKGNSFVAAADQNAFVAQGSDPDLSWIGRFAITLDFLNFMLPEKSKIQLGGSYSRDSQNVVAQNNPTLSKYLFDEVSGAEFLLELANKMIVIQAEYARMLNDIKVSGNNGLGTNVGITNVTDGWYADLLLDILPLLQAERAKGDALQLLFRLEDQNDYGTDPVSGALFAHTLKKSRAGAGVKWSYGGGKNHTAINYFVDAQNQMFGGNSMGANYLPPAQTIIVQQQFAFESGK